MKPNNLLYAKCTADSFYRAWMEFLTPFHKLTSREKDVAARLIAQYFKLKESISDPEVLRDVLWSRSSLKDIRESLGMTQQHFQMVRKKLKDAAVIKDGDLNKKYIPHKGTDSRFLLQVVFDWSSAKKPVTNATQ